MRLSTIRYYLHTFKSLQEQIVELTENLNKYRIMDIEDFIFPCTGQAGENQHYKHSSASTVENICIPRLKYIEKQEQELFRLTTIHSSINAVITRYDDNSSEWQILRLRYFEKDKQGKSHSWIWISEKIGYSEQHTRRMDTEICQQIQREMDKKIGRG